MGASVPYIVTLERRMRIKVRVYAATADEAKWRAGFQAHLQDLGTVDNPEMSDYSAVEAECEGGADGR